MSTMTMVYTDEDECIFHPFPSVEDTIFWVSAGGIVKKDTFRDNVFCKRIKELGNYYKTEEEAKIIADKLKEIFRKSWMQNRNYSVTRFVLNMYRHYGDESCISAGGDNSLNYAVKDEECAEDSIL